MALIKCKECGNDVSTKADACPKCGARLKSRPGCIVRLGKLIGGIVGAYIGLVVALSLLYGGKATGPLKENSYEIAHITDTVAESTPSAEATTVGAVSDEYSIPHAEQASSLVPSFDCSKANSKAETLICSDTELTQLDNELAVLYKQADSVALDKDAFNETNKDEWDRREKTCEDRDCLLAWYANRRDQLNEVINVETVHADVAPVENIPVATPPPVVDKFATYCEDMSKTVSYDQRQIFITNCLISARASQKLIRGW